jgi:hypothetical protein
VHCADSGVDELVGRGPVTPFAFGDELELDFERRLLAHGQPIVVGGKPAPATFVGGG